MHRRLSFLSLAAALLVASGCPSPPPVEPTTPGPEVCDNELDDNGDDKTDCADPKCFDDPACVQSTAEDCINLQDDDADGAVDCKDSDCAAHASCQVETPEVCTGGLDEDGDQAIDCADPDCENAVACRPKENCINNLEDNGDQFIDCEDETCAQDAACPSPEASRCTDGADNDGDGAVDCQDYDCVTQCPAQESTAALCSDGIDNDSDFLVDCNDSSCLLTTPCLGKVETDCANAADDDGDTLTDCADPDCASAANCQAKPEDCTNGVDDDKDTLTDCADSDCSTAPACQSAEDCTNKADDDGDQLADCADADCAGKSCGSGCVCNGMVAKETTCDDAADNDNDTKADCADADCAQATNCQPTGPETLCADGLDNDNDTRADCRDSDCDAQACGTGCLCAGAAKKETACNDTQDNDGDGQADCLDLDCAAATHCASLKVNDGQPCTADAQCKGGKCLTETATGFPGGTCTNAQACTVNSTTGCNGGYCYQRGSVTRCEQRCTGISGCRPGYECYDPDAKANTNNSYCIPLCTADSQCTATGQPTGYGCNPWSKFCELKQNNKAKYGAACTAHSDCETKWCDTSFPNGYCVGVCDGTTKSCGGDGVCLTASNDTDNVGTCWDGCTGNSQCRPSTYACFATTAGQNACYCMDSGTSCGDDRECCSGSCSWFWGWCN